LDAFTTAIFQAGGTVVSTLLLRHYRELGMTNTEFLIYLQLKSFADKGVDFPPTDAIANSLSLSDGAIFQQLHGMISKHLMQIKTIQQPDGLTRDSYDFTQLYEKLAQYVANQQAKSVDTQGATDREQIFQQIEAEFGRPLSPMEMETISKWIDDEHYPTPLIQLALKEAVLNQKYSLRYIERILISWQKKGIKTPEAAQRENESWRAQRTRSGQQQAGNNPNLKDVPNIPLFNIGDQPYQE
jgi:DNA replication protein